MTPATMVFALSHSLRRGILRLLLAQGSEATISPVAAADALGRPLPSVAYHFRVLAGRGLLVLTEKRKVRGTTQHFYRLSDAVTANGWAVNTLRAGEGAD